MQNLVIHKASVAESCDVAVTVGAETCGEVVAGGEETCVEAEATRAKPCVGVMADGEGEPCVVPCAFYDWRRERLLKRY